MLLFCIAAGAVFPAGTSSLVVLGSGTVLVGGLIGVFLRPRWVFFAFLVGCMSVPLVFERVFIPLGFMKLYVQDIVFCYNLVLIAARRSIGLSRYKPTPFDRYLLMHFALGLWALAVGLFVRGNNFDSSFGDFRRSFFYFMNYFIAIFLVESLQEARYLRRALLIGACLASLRGILQAVGGQFVYRRFGDAAHVLNHFEATFITFMVFYALGQVLFGKTARRWLWTILACIGTGVVILANFRACWLSLCAGLLFMFFYLPRRQKGTLVLLGAGLAVVLGLTVATLWEVQITETRSTIGQEILAKANISKTQQDVNVTWRFESYANALQQWRTSPIIGTGLGEVLEFFATTSTGGSMLAEAHRVHNSFIWLLMTLGVTGFAIFLYIQSRYIRFLLKYLKRTTWVEGRVTALACGAFYVSIMVSAAFEIFLESAMPITVLSSTMALSMLMMMFDPGRSPGTDPGSRAPELT